MIQVNERTIFSFALLVFAVLILVNAQGMHVHAVKIPKMIAYILLVFASIQFLSDAFPAIRKRITFLTKDVVEKNEEGETEKNETFGQRYLFIGWMVVFVILIFHTSMIWAILISLFLYLKWIAKESWKLTIVYSSIFTFAIYLIFVVGMNVYYFL